MADEVAPQKRRVIKKVVKRVNLEPEIDMEIDEDNREVKKAPPRKMLDRGPTRIALINDLAQPEPDKALLAAKYNVKPGEISDFQVKNRYDIEEHKKRVEKDELDEYALLSVAKKSNRVAIYQEQIRLCEDYIAWCEHTNRHIPPAIMKLQQTALRSVAEEVGDLKQNFTVEHTVVDSKINGVDIADVT